MDQSPTCTTPVAMDIFVQAQRAAAAGLIRVNGLPLWQFGDFGREVMHVIDPPVSEVGFHSSNNSRFALVTREGNMYWGHSSGSMTVIELRYDFMAEFSIEPGFIWVPASNGEEFLPHHLMQRLADPFCQPARGHTSRF